MDGTRAKDCNRWQDTVLKKICANQARMESGWIDDDNNDGNDGVDHEGWVRWWWWLNSHRKSLAKKVHCTLISSNWKFTILWSVATGVLKREIYGNILVKVS